MIETNQTYLEDTDELEHQVDQENLISGRLGYFYCKQDDDDDHVDDRPAHYGISRMGLAVAEPVAEPAAETPAETASAAAAVTGDSIELVSTVEQFAGPCRRGSYKLPAKLIGWLRAIAKTTDQFQYEIVATALGKHLAELTAGLDADKTAEVAQLRKEFADFLAEVDGEVATAGETVGEATEEAVEESSDETASAKPKRTASNWFGLKGEDQPPKTAG